MAKIDRVLSKIFASEPDNASDVRVFGSEKAGAPANAATAEEAERLGAWLKGWQGAVDNNNSPNIEGANAILLAITSHLKYFYQQGMPEYSSTETYYAGSFAKSNNKIIISLVDDNLNNDVSDVSFWQEFTSGLSRNDILNLAGLEAVKHIASEVEAFARKNISGQIPSGRLATGSISETKLTSEVQTKLNNRGSAPVIGGNVMIAGLEITRDVSADITLPSASTAGYRGLTVRNYDSRKVLWIVNNNLNIVKAFNPEGGAALAEYDVPMAGKLPVTTPTGLSFVEFGGNTFMYIVDGGADNDVQAVDMADRTTVVAASRFSYDSGNGYGMAHDETHLYLAVNKLVEVFSIDTHMRVGSFEADIVGASHITGIAVSDHFIFVTVNSDHTLYIFDKFSHSQRFDLSFNLADDLEDTYLAYNDDTLYVSITTGTIRVYHLVETSTSVGPGGESLGPGGVSPFYAQVRTTETSVNTIRNTAWVGNTFVSVHPETYITTLGLKFETTRDMLASIAATMEWAIFDVAVEGNELQFKRIVGRGEVPISQLVSYDVTSTRSGFAVTGLNVLLDADSSSLAVTNANRYVYVFRAKDSDGNYVLSTFAQQVDTPTTIGGDPHSVDLGTKEDVVMAKRVVLTGTSLNDLTDGRAFVTSMSQFILGLVGWRLGGDAEGGTLSIEDEGIEVNENASTLNFAGEGVTVTKAGDTALVTIPRHSSDVAVDRSNIGKLIATSPNYNVNSPGPEAFFSDSLGDWTIADGITGLTTRSDVSVGPLLSFSSQLAPPNSVSGIVVRAQKGNTLLRPIFIPWGLGPSDNGDRYNGYFKIPTQDSSGTNEFVNLVSENYGNSWQIYFTGGSGRLSNVVFKVYYWIGGATVTQSIVNEKSAFFQTTGKIEREANYIDLIAQTATDDSQVTGNGPVFALKQSGYVKAVTVERYYDATFTDGWRGYLFNVNVPDVISNTSSTGWTGGTLIGKTKLASYEPDTSGSSLRNVRVELETPVKLEKDQFVCMLVMREGLESQGHNVWLNNPYSNSTNANLIKDIPFIDEEFRLAPTYGYTRETDIDDVAGDRFFLSHTSGGDTAVLMNLEYSVIVEGDDITDKSSPLDVPTADLVPSQALFYTNRSSSEIISTVYAGMGVLFKHKTILRRWAFKTTNNRIAAKISFFYATIVGGKLVIGKAIKEVPTTDERYKAHFQPTRQYEKLSPSGIDIPVEKGDIVVAFLSRADGSAGVPVFKYAGDRAKASQWRYDQGYCDPLQYDLYFDSLDNIAPVARVAGDTIRSVRVEFDKVIEGVGRVDVEPGALAGFANFLNVTQEATNAPIKTYGGGCRVKRDLSVKTSQIRVQILNKKHDLFVGTATLNDQNNWINKESRLVATGLTPKTIDGIPNIISVDLESPLLVKTGELCWNAVKRTDGSNVGIAFDRSSTVKSNAVYDIQDLTIPTVIIRKETTSFEDRENIGDNFIDGNVNNTISFGIKYDLLIKPSGQPITPPPPITPTQDLTESIPDTKDLFRYTAISHLIEKPDLDFFVDARLPVIGMTSARMSDKNVVWVLQNILTIPQATPYDVDTKQRLTSAFISQASPGSVNPHNLGTVQASDIAFAIHTTSAGVQEPRMVFADNNGHILRSFKIGTTDYDAERNISFGSEDDIATAIAYDEENDHIYVIVDNTISRYHYANRTPVTGTIDLSSVAVNPKTPFSLTVEGNLIIVAIRSLDTTTEIHVYDKTTLKKIDNVDEGLSIRYLSSLNGVIRGAIPSQHLVKGYTLRNSIEEHKTTLDDVKSTIIVTDNLASKVVADASDDVAASEKAVLSELIKAEVLYFDKLSDTARDNSISYLGTPYREEGARQDGNIVVAKLTNISGSDTLFRGYSKENNNLYGSPLGDINPHDADAGKNALAEAQILAVGIKSDTIRIVSLLSTFKSIKTVQLGNRTYHLPPEIRTEANDTVNGTTKVTSFDLNRASINIPSTVAIIGATTRFNIQFEDDTWLYEDGRAFMVGFYRHRLGDHLFLGSLGGGTTIFEGDQTAGHSPTRVKTLPTSPLVGNEIYLTEKTSVLLPRAYSTLTTDDTNGFSRIIGWGLSDGSWGLPSGHTDDSSTSRMVRFLVSGLTGNCDIISDRVTSIIYYKISGLLPRADRYASTTVCGSSTSSFGTHRATLRITEVIFEDENSEIRYYKFDETAGPAGETTTTEHWRDYYVEDTTTFRNSDPAQEKPVHRYIGERVGGRVENVKSYVLRNDTFDIVQDLASRHPVDRAATVGHAVSIGISRRPGITPTQTFPVGTPSNIITLEYYQVGTTYPNSLVIEVEESEDDQGYLGDKFRIDDRRFTWELGTYGHESFNGNQLRRYHFAISNLPLPTPLTQTTSTVEWKFNFEDRKDDRYPAHDVIGEVWLWNKKQ